MKLFVSLPFLWLAFSFPGLAAEERDKILELARQTIEKARYATLATVDEKGQPHPSGDV